MDAGGRWGGGEGVRKGVSQGKGELSGRQERRGRMLRVGRGGARGAESMNEKGNERKRRKDYQTRKKNA